MIAVYRTAMAVSGDVRADTTGASVPSAGHRRATARRNRVGKWSIFAMLIRCRLRARRAARAATTTVGEERSCHVDLNALDEKIAASSATRTRKAEA